MRHFILTVLGVLTALFIALIAVPAGLVLALSPPAERLPARMVLELDLAVPVAEQPGAWFRAFAEPRPVTLAGLHGGLAHAATDDRVAGLYIRGGGGAVSPAGAEEILEAMAAFKAAGKPVFAFAQDIAPDGLGDYLVLSQADRLWMQPTGSFLPAGLTLRTAFLKGTLDKIGVEPDFVRFSEYKGAADIFTERAFTPAQREANTALLATIDTVVSGGIAAARGLSRDQVTAALEAAPLPAEEARAAGLADALAYESAVRDTVLDEAGARADFVTLQRYVARRARPFRTGPVIATVYGEGMIVPGEAPPPGPFGGEPVIGSATMARAIADAAADGDVRSIVVRINSPGGSAAASDEVWNAIRAAREAGKPVIASMGEVAASGGYYIPAGADVIVAHAATITGSIGIVGGKFAVGGLFDTLGISTDAVATTTNADLWASETPFSEEQRARFARWLEVGYEDFKARVAAGRDLSAAETEAIAKGRVWAGWDAAALGLVDRLGGFGAALEAARERAGLDPRAEITLRRYPEPRSLRQEVFGMARDADAALGALSLLSALLADPDMAGALAEIAAARTGATAHATVPALR